MEIPTVDPRDIMSARTRGEKIVSLLRSNHPTKELINRLQELDSLSVLPHINEPFTLNDVEKYIYHEDSRIKKRYPPENTRYNQDIENDRKRAIRMKKLFDNRQYPPLIKMMMDSAVKCWQIADRADKTAQEWWTPEQIAQLAQAKEDAIEQEKEISRIEQETGVRQEYGIDPSFLEVGGDSNRMEGAAFLCYAIALAKALKE